MQFLRPHLYDGERHYTHVTGDNKKFARIISDDIVGKPKKAIFLEKDRGDSIEYVTKKDKKEKDVYSSDDSTVKRVERMYVPVPTYKVSFQEAFTFAKQGFCISRLEWFDKILTLTNGKLIDQSGDEYTPDLSDTSKDDWCLADYKYGISRADSFKYTTEMWLRDNPLTEDQKKWMSLFDDFLIVQLLIAKPLLPQLEIHHILFAKYLSDEKVLYTVEYDENRVNFYVRTRDGNTNDPSGNPAIKDWKAGVSASTKDIPERNLFKALIGYMSYKYFYNDYTNTAGSTESDVRTELTELKGNSMATVLINKMHINNLFSWYGEGIFELNSLLYNINDESDVNFGLLVKYNKSMIDKMVDELVKDIVAENSSETTFIRELRLIRNYYNHQSDYKIPEIFLMLGNKQNYDTFRAKLSAKIKEHDDIIKMLLTQTPFGDWDESLFNKLIDLCHIIPHTDYFKSTYGKPTEEWIQHFLNKTHSRLLEEMIKDPNPRVYLDKSRMAGEQFLIEKNITIPTPSMWLEMEKTYWPHRVLFRYFYGGLTGLLQREIREDVFQKIFFIVLVMKSEEVTPLLPELDKIMSEVTL